MLELVGAVWTSRFERFAAQISRPRSFYLCGSKLLRKKMVLDETAC